MKTNKNKSTFLLDSKVEEYKVKVKPEILSLVQSTEPEDKEKRNLFRVLGVDKDIEKVERSIKAEKEYELIKEEFKRPVHKGSDILKLADEYDLKIVHPSEVKFEISIDILNQLADFNKENEYDAERAPGKIVTRNKVNLTQSNIFFLVDDKKKPKSISVYYHDSNKGVNYDKATDSIENKTYILIATSGGNFSEWKSLKKYFKDIDMLSSIWVISVCSLLNLIISLVVSGDGFWFYCIFNGFIIISSLIFNIVNIIRIYDGSFDYIRRKYESYKIEAKESFYGKVWLKFSYFCLAYTFIFSFVCWNLLDKTFTLENKVSTVYKGEDMSKFTTKPELYNSIKVRYSIVEEIERSVIPFRYKELSKKKSIVNINHMYSELESESESE